MTVEESSLPRPNSSWVKEMELDVLPHCLNAYNRVLKAEQHATEKQEKQNIISARVAGFLLLEFRARRILFGNTACSELALWLVSPLRWASGDEHDVVFSVGKLCRDKLILRSSNTKYDSPSSHLSRQPFETLEDMIKDSVELTNKDYGASRKKALARDGFRCMITGMIDETSLKHNKELQRIAKRDGIVNTTVETCHILNESTMQGIDPEARDTGEGSPIENKTHYAAGAMAILESFGFTNLAEAFRNAGGIHYIWNLLSLEHFLHQKFDRMDLWFECTTERNRYKVTVFDEQDEGYIHTLNTMYGSYKIKSDMVVEFTSQSQLAELPNPELLALHAACARVAHMSGAAGFFDQVEWDAEETKVLALDGSSAPLLSNLISPFAVVHGVA